MDTLDHVTIVVSDYARSKTFYERALSPLGIELVMAFGQSCGFGRNQMPAFWIGSGPMTFQSAEQLQAITPVHVAFAAKSRADVDAFYEAAVAAGAKDFGRPGLRPEYHPNYYGAFVRDPDGNNVEAVCHAPESS